jgi:hypothetical protein
LIALYAIEKDISPDIDFLQTLEDSGDLDEAEELYNKFSNNELYESTGKSDWDKEDWINFHEE